MRQRDLALSFLRVAAIASVTLSAQATPLPAPAKTYSRSNKLAVEAQVPFALRVCSGFVISIDAGVLRALMGSRVLIGVGPGSPQVGVRALRALLVPRLCTTSSSMRQPIAPWLIPSRAPTLD
jgi:hypothetical protein